MVKQVVNRFAELLAAKARKENRKISNRTAADEMGLHRNAINDYSNNTVDNLNRHSLLKICEYLDCSPGDLIVIEEVAAAEEESSLSGQIKEAIPAVA